MIPDNLEIVVSSQVAHGGPCLYGRDWNVYNKRNVYMMNVYMMNVYIIN